MAEGPDAPQREDDPRDTRIKQQDREISRLRGDLAQVNGDRDRWKRHSERLQQQLDTARRAGFRQAAPFAKDRPQGRGGRPGRRAGARYGRQACRRRPAQVDETHAAPVPAACPDCGGAIEVTRVASQYQEEIPAVRPVVRRFDIEVGHCSRCQRRVQGRHALQTSDALGAAGAQLGPGVVALVVELHTEMGVPLAKVAHVLRTTFGLQVTPGGLAHLLHRTARDAAPTYTALCEQVRNLPLVTPEEPGGGWLPSTGLGSTARCLPWCAGGTSSQQRARVRIAHRAASRRCRFAPPPAPRPAGDGLDAVRPRTLVQIWLGCRRWLTRHTPPTCL